ncbi:MAG: anthranilate phosphoribosyltransferase [Abditibacteriota bacterium]|nr:anthranilate phosphoribosyltransferase [Abditibacteriota bacterium]
MSESTLQVLEALRAVTNGASLTDVQAEATLSEIMSGSSSSLQIAALLGALRMRGETIEEIVGFARAMRTRAVKVSSSRTPLVDTCGTGGDASVHGLSTFNVSTAAAFIAAGAGVAIAKHGNRAMSSRCGSADVLEALGVNLSLNAEQIGRCIDEVGIGFMFAQNHHPAMKHVAPIRRELGIRTIFNLLGPLANPAGAQAQVMGVSDARWIEPIAHVLASLGVERAIVAHSRDGMDEFSTCAPTDYIEVRNGQLTAKVLSPQELGCACTNPQSLAGGDAQTNATIISQLLHDGQGATADIACLNAAAALIVAGATEDFKDGLKLARASVSSGGAREKLALLAEWTQQAAAQIVT